MATDYLFIPFRAHDARIVGDWHYPGAYAFYDQPFGRLITAATLRPLWSVMGLDLYSVIAATPARELLGIFSFTRHGRESEIGLAMRPDLTGQGRGLAFVEAGLAFGRSRYHPRAFVLYVAEFNERAITVYTRAGFHKVRRLRRTGEGGRVWHWEMRRDESATERTAK